MRRALLSILCAVALAGCGGEKKAETESEAPSREAQAACTGSALASAPKLPPSFPQIEADKLTYTKQETVGPTVVVEGYFHGDVEEAHEEFQKELKGAGFTILFDELEEDDAEISYRTKDEATEGQVALRSCDEDRTSVHITNRPS